MSDLDELIQELLLEDPKLYGTIIPDNLEKKKIIFRFLCNVRKPKKISETFIVKQNEYLTKELKTHIIDYKHEKNIKKNLYIIKDNIANLKVDAILIPSDETLLGCFTPLHNCASNLIHSFAGVELRKKCSDELNGKLYCIEDYIITDSYNLPCSKIIHMVFPSVFNNINETYTGLLEECISKAITIAIKKNYQSIAIPIVDYTDFNYPKKEAQKITIKVIKEYLNRKSNINIILVVNNDQEEKEYIKLLNIN